MPTPDHRLEGRATMLAQRIVQRRDNLAANFRAPGDRTLFTEQKTSGEALDWWTIHRNDPLGKKVIDRWVEADPAQAMLTLASLDNALSQKFESENLEPMVPDAAP